MVKRRVKGPDAEEQEKSEEKASEKQKKQKKKKNDFVGFGDRDVCGRSFCCVV